MRVGVFLCSGRRRSRVGRGGGGGQVPQKFGLEWTLVSMHTKVSVCCMHLCIPYCDIMYILFIYLFTTKGQNRPLTCQ